MAHAATWTAAGNSIVIGGATEVAASTDWSTSHLRAGTVLHYAARPDHAGAPLVELAPELRRSAGQAACIASAGRRYHETRPASIASAIRSSMRRLATTGRQGRSVNRVMSAAFRIARAVSRPFAV